MNGRSLFESQLREILLQLQEAHYKVTSEMGKVTEEVLPQTLLQQILALIMNQGHLSFEWDYQTLAVKYMFAHEGKLFCKVHVPLLDGEMFRSYRISTVMNPEGAGYLQEYHNVKVAVGT